MMTVVRRMLSRLGVGMGVLAGLAAGGAARMMWQPRVVMAPPTVDPAPAAREAEMEAPSALAPGAVAAPGGIDPEGWQLLLERPKAGPWAATLDRLHADGRMDLRDLVLLSWCDVDGAAALAWIADRTKDGPDSILRSSGSFRQWIADHPVESLKTAMALGNRTLAEVVYMFGWPSIPDAAAFREILDSATGRWSGLAADLCADAATNRRSDFLKLASADPELAARILRMARLSRFTTEPIPFSTLWGELQESDPKAAERMMAASSPRDRALWQADLIGLLATSDPEAAARRLAAMPDGSARDAAAASVLQALARTDPQGAQALATQWGLDAFQTENASDTLRSLAASHPEAALAEAERLAASAHETARPLSLSDDVIATLAAADWKRGFALALQTNARQALQMLRSKDPEAQANGLAALREFGATDANAANKAVSALAELENATEIKSLIEGAADNPLTVAARLWAASQPAAEDSPMDPFRPDFRPPDAATAQALSTLDPSLVPPRMYSDTASSWAQQEPDRASQWVADLPAGPAKDAAIGGLIDALIGEPLHLHSWFHISSRGYQVSQSPPDVIDYASALTWAAAAGDPATRDDLSLRTARRWLDTDPAAATDGLRTGDLPDDQRQRLLNELGIDP